MREPVPRVLAGTLPDGKDLFDSVVTAVDQIVPVNGGFPIPGGTKEGGR